MRIGINYFEDKCNSIELQAIELLGVSVRVCARMCVCLCAYVCVFVCCVFVVGVCM